MLIYDLPLVARAKNEKGCEREIISINEDIVKYRVVKHTHKRFINTINTIKRKTFVAWLDGVQLKKDSFKRGDIVEFKGTKLVVLSNKGAYGKVKSLEHGFVIEEFYWRGYTDDRTFKIGFYNRLKK